MVTFTITKRKVKTTNFTVLDFDNYDNSSYMPFSQKKNTVYRHRLRILDKLKSLNNALLSSGYCFKSLIASVIFFSRHPKALERLL